MFEISENNVKIEFNKLEDTRENLKLIFVTLIERMTDDGVIRFEYQAEGEEYSVGIFIGRKLYLYFIYLPDKKH